MPQWYPRPGASCALANALPTMTASAPQASALQTSPPLLIPPSVMIGTYRDVFLKYASRAAAQSTVAVTCGTPSPSTPREVQAAPGPTPTKTAAGPHSIISRVTSYPTVFPTITGMRISRQNFSRSSDLYSDEMWRTVETVLCTTKTSAPASWAVLPNSAARWGIELTAATTPASLIWRTRAAIRSC